MKKNYYIGIDLGGTKISGALSDENGEIISKITIPTKAHEGEIPVLSRIIDAIDSVLNDANKTTSDIKGIGIGSPGPLNAKLGLIVETPNLPFKNFNLVKPIEEKFGVPTYLDNDANVAAIGEFLFGAGKGSENMIFVTVSTGVGGGAIINRKIYRGNTNNALEIGHTTVDRDGPRCNCGNYGCVEALSSGTAIARIANEAIEKGEKTTLKNYEKISAYEVFIEAENGDKVANKIINNSLNYLGICIANTISYFDPEVVILGGGVSIGHGIVIDTVQAIVKERCFKTLSENTKIVLAGLGNDAGVIGAVALAITESK